MTPTETHQDITRGLYLRERIKNDTAELKAIETRLEAAALIASHSPLQDADREGKQAHLFAENGILPIIFESDLLIGSVAADSQQAKDLQFLLEFDDNFKKLFREKHIFERKESDGHKFRKKLRGMVQEETFHTVCNILKSKDKDGIVKSKTVIAWDKFNTQIPTA